MSDQHQTTLANWLLGEAVGHGERRYAEAADRIETLERMVRRLALKLERVDGVSVATQDARRIVDFDAVPNIPVEITEAARG